MEVPCFFFIHGPHLLTKTVIEQIIWADSWPPIRGGNLPVYQLASHCHLRTVQAYLTHRPRPVSPPKSVRVLHLFLWFALSCDTTCFGFKLGQPHHALYGLIYYVYMVFLRVISLHQHYGHCLTPFIYLTVFTSIFRHFMLFP